MQSVWTFSAVVVRECNNLRFVICTCFTNMLNCVCWQNGAEPLSGRAPLERGLESGENKCNGLRNAREFHGSGI